MGHREGGGGQGEESVLLNLCCEICEINLLYT